MSGVELFEVFPTELACQDLRRFAWSSQAKCPGKYGYHNAQAELPEILPLPMKNKDGDTWNGFGFDDVDHADPRWPTHCDCGYAFQEADEWQHNAGRLWKRPGSEQLLIFDHRARGAHACGAVDAPAGALRDCSWYRDFWCGPDGRSAEVVLPDGCLWLIDGPANNGPGWTRTGTWPKITANPSILTPGYHGWLRDGVLVPC